MSGARILEDLTRGFDLERHRYVFLIGGGGKTTLLFTLARALLRTGARVITTTSTRIRRPRLSESRVVLADDDLEGLATATRDVMGSTRHVTMGRVFLPDGEKLIGFSAVDLDWLKEANLSEWMLVEADGSAGRSIKAHAPYEPVVSSRADLVIAVVGADCLGVPVEEAYVHRPERFAALLDLPPGSQVRPEHVAGILHHPLGYLGAVHPCTEVAVYLSKAGSGEGKEAAPLLADAIWEADREERLGRVVLGELHGTSRFCRVAHARER